MSHDAQTLPEAAAASLQAPRPASRRRVRSGGPKSTFLQDPLRRLFWAGLVALVIWVGLKSPGQSPESVIGALLIIAAAMVPAALWVYRKAPGLPIFPICALTTVWTFGLPLVSDHPILVLFPAWNQLVGALSVTGFLLAGTLSWYAMTRRPIRPPAVCWMIDEERIGYWLLVVLAVCALVTVGFTAKWIVLSPGAYSFSSACLLACEALVCFVLSFRFGRGRLSGLSKLIYFVLLGVLFLAQLPGLVLIANMSLVAVGFIAYAAGSKRLPWRMALLALCIYSFLHVGKSDMRQKYWYDDQAPTIGPLQFPGFLAEWAATSAQVLRSGETADDAGQTLIERASLMHWLLYFQLCSPDAIPFLHGATYAVIPSLFVPRMFEAEKPRSHEATYLMAIHYNIQTREDTDSTTIAFGMINEAYANFGFLGMGALGLVLGLFYGSVSHWSRRMPILSFRALFAVLVASYSFQAEFTSTVYVAALFQSTMVLLLLTVLFMRPGPVRSARVSMLD